MLDLAITAIALVSPWLAKVGEGAAKKIGEKAVEKLAGIYDLIKAQFCDENEALILLNLERSPANPDAQEAAAKVLSNKMKANGKLAGDVGHLVNEAKSDPAVAQFLTQVYGGEVGKIVNINTAGDVTIS